MDTSARFASRLLRVFAVVQLAAIAVAGVIVWGGTQDVVARALALDIGDFGEAGAFVVVAGATVGAGLALVLGLTALLVSGRVARGGARVGIWILGVATVAWYAGVAIVNPEGGPLSLLAGLADTDGKLSAEQLTTRLNDALPSWYQGTYFALAAASVLIMIVVLTTTLRTKTPATAAS